MFPAGLHTPRLILRPLMAADADALFAAYGHDPEVCRYMTWRPHASVEQTQAFVRRAISAGSSRTYALVPRTGGGPLGTLELRDLAPFRVEFGYVLARAAWGQGLMSEALTEAVRWALAQPEIWRIGGVCDVENRASARVMEKAGLTREGILRRWILHPNISDVPRDCFNYAKTR